MSKRLRKIHADEASADHAREELEQRTVELQAAIEALKKSEIRLKLALDIETIGVIFFDSAGRITDCNTAFLRMTGFTREDFDSGELRWDKVSRGTGSRQRQPPRAIFSPGVQPSHTSASTTARTGHAGGVSSPHNG